jgi:hypothetical protein
VPPQQSYHRGPQMMPPNMPIPPQTHQQSSRMMTRFGVY